VERPPAARAEPSFARGVDRLLAGLETGSAEEASADLVAAAEAAEVAGLHDWRPAAQVRVFRWLKARKPDAPDALRLGTLLGIRA